MAESGRKEGIAGKVTVGVIVALIVAAVLGSVKYFVPEVWEWLSRQADHLGEPVAVSRWWHWLLVAYFVTTLLAVTGLIGWAYRSQVEHHAYTRDRIMSVNWQWRWSGDRVVNLWCRCDCGRQMVYAERRSFKHAIDGTVETFLECEPCRVSAVRRPGHLQHALREVEREIDLKVHNGSWRQVVESQKQQAV